MGGIKKADFDALVAKVTDLNTNLGLGLTQIQQNVNTVGEVAAGNSTAVSAGSAKAGVAPGGTDWGLIVTAAAAVAGLYMVMKK